MKKSTLFKVAAQSIGKNKLRTMLTMLTGSLPPLCVSDCGDDTSKQSKLRVTDG